MLFRSATGRKFEVKPGTQPLPSGAYELDVAELPAGLEFKSTKFTIKRGKEERVKVTLKSPTDLERLQGLWQPVAAEVMGVTVPDAFIATETPPCPAVR